MSRPAAAADRSPLVDLQETLYASSNPTRRWLHNDRRERISAEIRAAAAAHPSGRALEVGPGAGPYVELLCTSFPEVVASDVEGRYLEHVRTRHGHRPELTLLEDDIESSALEPQGFDTILCTEVIEHVAAPAAVLDSIFRLLRPGGTLILSTPQPYSPVELLGRVAFRPGVIRLTRAIYREPVLPTGHISLLSRRRLGAMLRRTGFRIEASGVGGLYLPLLAEVGGERALRVERRLAPALAAGPLRGLLWTQYWTARRPT